MLGKEQPLSVERYSGVVPDVVSPQAEEVHGLVQQMKAGAIQRKAALEKMKALTNSQLDVFKHQLQDAARVKKIRVLRPHRAIPAEA